MSTGRVFVIFDGPPEHAASRFVEVESDNRESRASGAWADLGNGYWSLGPFVCAHAHAAEVAALSSQRDALLAACEKARSALNNIGTGKWSATPVGDALRAAITKAKGE